LMSMLLNTMADKGNRHGNNHKSMAASVTASGLMPLPPRWLTPVQVVADRKEPMREELLRSGWDGMQPGTAGLGRLDGGLNTMTYSHRAWLGLMGSAADRAHHAAHSAAHLGS
jgi:hypothetical protein